MDQIVEPCTKRSKIEANGSTSSKREINVDCPILMLPEDILAKVIAFIPIAQWAALELLPDFRPATLIAWRQLRTVNLYREFLTKSVNQDERISFRASIGFILQKLVECSPFLTSINGIDFQSVDGEINSDAIHSLAKFEHLQSITAGDTFSNDRKIPLESVVEFLESTRSRTTLKELHLYHIEQRRGDRATILEQFASSFANGREIQFPLQLEKFTFASSDSLRRIRLDTLDTTRLTDVRLRKASIEPDQLTSLIERASHLCRIEQSLLFCASGADCTNRCQQATKTLLNALAAHECLTAISFSSRGCNPKCTSSDFNYEFIEMLKTIGRRRNLTKLFMDQSFVCYTTIDINEVCATIRDYIPYLQSMKIYFDDINDGNVSDIVRLPELRELDLSNCSSTPVMSSAIQKFSLLSHLKRLSLTGMQDIDEDSLDSLAPSTSLMDLRFSNASCISADVFDKWSDGFAANLEILMLEGIAEQDDEDEAGLVRLLEKTGRLRVFILTGAITDLSLIAIANSCPHLEILGVSSCLEFSVDSLQDVVNCCPKLRTLGGIGRETRSELQFTKYRKISEDVDMEFWNYDFDDSQYG